MSESSTQFAPSERASLQVIEAQHQQFTVLKILGQILDAVPNGVVILNPQRQIVYANQSFVEYVGASQQEEILGLRPGEAVRCLHAEESNGACGATEFCRTCGAVHAILQAQRGKPSTQECRITQEIDGRPQALDLRVWANPFVLNDETFTIFAVADIANEKRRRVLEHIFFHDLRNTAGAIYGFAELMATGETDILDEDVSSLLTQASRKLVDEIDAQQQLLAAETGDLAVYLSAASSLDILTGVLQIYRSHKVAQGRHLQLFPDSENFILDTDERLLSRVIGNMIKNGLEACPTGETVTVGCQLQGDEGEFWVHNPSFMPRRVQLQVFQRSFSTKGSRRGLGTYGMRLLSEQYLNGRVAFTTNPTAGTTFTATYPLSQS